MKAVLIGDCHFGSSLAFGKSNQFGINSRLDDYEQSFAKIIDYTLENKIRIVLFTGDIFEIRNPTPVQVSTFYRQLKRLYSADVECHILVGNHDQTFSRSLTSTLEPLVEISLPNVFIHSNVEMTLIRSKDTDEAINVVFVPYRKRQFYDMDNNNEALKAMGDEIGLAISKADSAYPTIAVVHMMFEGTIPSDAGDYGLNELILPFNMFAGVDITIAGHIHRASILKKDPLFIYSGSMETKDFSEKDHKKVFLVYDSSKAINDSVSFYPIETRPFIDFEFDYGADDCDDPMRDVLEKIEKTKLDGAVVRVSVKIHELKIQLIDVGIIRSKLNEMGVSCISDVVVVPIVSRTQRNKEVNDAPDDITAFKHYVESQIDVNKSVLELGLQIMKEKEEANWIR